MTVSIADIKEIIIDDVCPDIHGDLCGVDRAAITIAALYAQEQHEWQAAYNQLWWHNVGLPLFEKLTAR